MYGVGVVVDSKYEGLAAGDIVVNSAMDSWPWQLYFKVSNKGGKFKKFEFKDEDPKLELTYYGKSSVHLTPFNFRSEVAENKRGQVGPKESCFFWVAEN